jgi:beta-galactosidase
MNGKVVFSFVIAGIMTAGVGGQPQDKSRSVTPVTKDWKFVKADVNGAESLAFDDANWTDVAVPHTWNDKDTLKGSNYYRGPGWYRTKLAIPESAKGKRVFIRFEAASLVADVYFNGVHLGQHRGGFTAFCYELTPHIRWAGENVLAVRVDNSHFEDVPPLSGDFNIFGGIYRPVWLIITNPVCITPVDYASPGIYMKQTKISKEEAVVDILAKVSNGLDKPAVVQSRVTIVGPDSVVVAKAEGQGQIAAGQTMSVNHQIRIANPRLWNGRKDPYLYETQVELLCDGNVVDVVGGPLGLRYFSVDPNKGFFLNGEPYPLHGVNRHQDRIGKGWAISYANQDEDANLILEIGATCVRLAHYPHSDYFYSLCDKNGLVVWAELPMVNQVLDTPGFRDNAKQQLTELIRRQYNHPSIMFWSLYNELGNSGKCDDPRPLLTELQSLAKQEDPTRLTTAASNDPSNKWPGVRAIADLVAWNTYPGWYRATPPQMNQDIDKYKRDANDKPVGISEYGAGASVKHHEQNMKKGPVTAGKRHPEEWQAIVHEENYAAMEARPYLWGTYVWVMFDFASAWRNEGDAPGVNDKGLVTADRKTRKDAFYFYKAKWTIEPLVYITSRRHIERTDPNTTVKIYSNCDSVELKVNGQGLGSKTSTNCIFKWPDVQLKEGLNTIEAIATRGDKTCTDKCEWQLTEASTSAEPNKAGESGA